MLVGLVLIWAAAVAAGLGWLNAYSFESGPRAKAPADWPEGVDVPRALDRPTLVMVAHPHCSCTRASIGELAELMAAIDARVAAFVLFVRPDGFEEDWERTDLYESASIIPGVTVLRDDGGAMAARFGAMTSGQAYLFSANGALLFQGGITPQRSHMGDSVGSDRIISLVTTGEADRATSDVYGCPLTDEEDGRSVALGAGGKRR